MAKGQKKPHKVCQLCGLKKSPTHFPQYRFICSKCFKKLDKSEMSYVEAKALVGVPELLHPRRKRTDEKLVARQAAALQTARDELLKEAAAEAAVRRLLRSQRDADRPGLSTRSLGPHTPVGSPNIRHRKRRGA